MLCYLINIKHDTQKLFRLHSPEKFKKFQQRLLNDLKEKAEKKQKAKRDAKAQQAAEDKAATEELACDKTTHYWDTENLECKKRTTLAKTCSDAYKNFESGEQFLIISKILTTELPVTSKE